MHISNYLIINVEQQSEYIFVCLAAAASISILVAYLLIQMFLSSTSAVTRHEQLAFLLDMDLGKFCKKFPDLSQSLVLLSRDR